jgi:hypothetical protein
MAPGVFTLNFLCGWFAVDPGVALRSGGRQAAPCIFTQEAV